MEAYILVQRDGRDTAVRRLRFLSQIHLFYFPNSHVFRKSGNQHFCPKPNIYYGFKGNCLGQNVHNDRGIISGFREKCHFDLWFAGQSPCFPENLNFCFFCLNNSFPCGEHIREAFIFLDPIHSHGFH